MSRPTDLIRAPPGKSRTGCSAVPATARRSSFRPTCSTWRSVWLLTRLRLRRLLNQFTFVYNRRLSGRNSRAATPGKRRNPWLVTAFVAIAMVFTTGNLSRVGILNLHGTLDAVSTVGGIPDYTAVRRAYTLDPGAFSDRLTHGLTMELSLLFCVAVLMTVGGRELAQPDWDLEWLVTLPARKRALLWSRVVERSVANPSGIVML